MLRTRLPSWQNHQTHRIKILQSGGAQPVNTSYRQQILTSSAVSIFVPCYLSDLALNSPPVAPQWCTGKDKPPSASLVPGATSLPPLIITEQPDFSTLVRQAVTAAMEGLSQQMALLESAVGGRQEENEEAQEPSPAPQRSIGVILRVPRESSTSSGSSAGHPRAPCGEQWTSSEKLWRLQPQQWQPPQPW